MKINGHIHHLCREAGVSAERCQENYHVTATEHITEQGDLK